MKRIAWFYIVFLFSHFYGLSQDGLKFINFKPDGIMLQANYGFISPHHNYMHYLLKGHVKSFELETFHRLNGYKYWHRLYKYPYMSLGYYFADLGNPEQLGQAHAVYGKIGIPVRKSEHWMYNLAAGVAYLTKKFDPRTNYYDMIIGSHINFYFRTGMTYFFNLGQKLSGGINLNLVHYSNGNVREPNAGYNIISVGTVVNARFNNLKILQKEPELPEVKKNNYRFYAAAGYKSVSEDVYNTYLVYTFSAEYVRRFDLKNAMSCGADFFYDRSLYYFMLFSGRDFKNSYLYQSGIHIGYEPYWGNTSISLQWGVYLYNELMLRGIFYHRAAITQKIKHFLLSLSIMSHFFSADILEWRVGYEF